MSEEKKPMSLTMTVLYALLGAGLGIVLFLFVNF